MARTTAGREERTIKRVKILEKSPLWLQCGDYFQQTHALVVIASVAVLTDGLILHKWFLPQTNHEIDPKTKPVNQDAILCRKIKVYVTWKVILLSDTASDSVNNNDGTHKNPLIKFCWHVRAPKRATNVLWRQSDRKKRMEKSRDMFRWVVVDTGLCVTTCEGCFCFRKEVLHIIVK